MTKTEHAMLIIEDNYRRTFSGTTSGHIAHALGITDAAARKLL